MRAFSLPRPGRVCNRRAQVQPERQLCQHPRLLPLRLPRRLQRGWLLLLRWGP